MYLPTLPFVLASMMKLEFCPKNCRVLSAWALMRGESWLLKLWELERSGVDGTGTGCGTGLESADGTGSGGCIAGSGG